MKLLEAICKYYVWPVYIFQEIFTCTTINDAVSLEDAESLAAVITG